MKIEFDTPAIHNVDVNGLRVDVFCHLRSNSSKIVCLGQSALSKDNRAKGLPFFFRSTWYEDITCSVVCFNDPTLYLYDDLLAGWSQGTPEHFAIPAMAEVCTWIAALYGDAAKLGFYGSSAGGFWAMMMAAYLETPCAVETPQTDMFQYPLEDPRELLFDRCYRDHGLNPEDYRHRLNVIDWFEHLQRYPSRIDFYQSRTDFGHVTSQMDPFFARIGTRMPIHRELYDRPADKPAHGPMTKRRSLHVINTLLD